MQQRLWPLVGTIFLGCAALTPSPDNPYATAGDSPREATTSDNVAEAASRTLKVLAQPSASQPPPGASGIRIRGRVVVAGGPKFVPPPSARLRLVGAHGAVQTTSTDREGNFVFRGPLDEGHYELTIESDRYEGESAFDLGSRTEDLVLTARPLPAK
jgi:hypothetical protein